MKIGKVIKESMSKNFNVGVKVRTTLKPYEEVEKRLFVETIAILQKSVDRSLGLILNFGVDLSTFEQNYYKVVGNLFKLRFSKYQIYLIESFLAKEETEALTVSVTREGVKETLHIETSEDLYFVLLELED
jgi:hypothetical protein